MRLEHVVLLPNTHCAERRKRSLIHQRSNRTWEQNWLLLNGILPRTTLTRIMNSTEVQNPRCKLDDKYLCLSYVFGSVLASMCKVCSRVSEALLLTLLTSSNISSSDSKAFLCYIAFSGSPTAVHRPLHALL